MTDPAASQDAQNPAEPAPPLPSSSSPAEPSLPPTVPPTIDGSTTEPVPALASSPGTGPTAQPYGEIPQEPLPEDGLVEIVSSCPMLASIFSIIPDLYLHRMTGTPRMVAMTLYRE